MDNLILKLPHRSNVYSVKRQDLHLQLLSHNEYLSLKSITDTQDYFGTENIAANIPKDILSQLPNYLLAFKLKTWSILCLVISAILLSQLETLFGFLSSWNFSFRFKRK